MGLKKPPTRRTPIERATIGQIKAWLSDQEADMLTAIGKANRIPSWPVTFENLAIALRRAGVKNTDTILNSTEASIDYLCTKTTLLKEYVLVIGHVKNDSTWVQISSSVNTDVYIWGARSSSLPLTLGLLVLCVACYPPPKNAFDEGYFFQATLT